MTPPKKPKVKRTPPPPTPKTPKPWDVPPPPSFGDRNAEALYSAIGLALTRWGRLEDVMAHIFSSLVSSTESEPAARAFGSVITFRGRKEMIEAAAEAFFFLYPDTGEITKYLEDLLNDANRFSARRNEIAHGIVQENTAPVYSKHIEVHIARLATTIPKKDPKYPLGFVLRPTDYTTNKTQMERGRTIIFPVSYIPDYVYSSVEVHAFARYFEELHARAIRLPLAIFHHRLKANEQAAR